MDRISKAVYFLKNEFPKGIQVFNSRNIVGDIMTNIYDDDGISIDYCYSYDYIEVFGVTGVEYKYICDSLGNDRWNGDYEGN